MLHRFDRMHLFSGVLIKGSHLCLLFPFGCDLMLRPSPPNMIYLLFSVVTLVLIGVIMIIWAHRRAPEGQENERGFRRTGPSSLPHEPRGSSRGENPMADPVVPVAREASKDGD